MNKLPTIKQLKELHTKFHNMYAFRENCPLVGVCDSHVHIEEDYATQYAPLEDWKVTYHDDTYPVRIETVVNGLKLISVMSTERAKELGFIKDTKTCPNCGDPISDEQSWCDVCQPLTGLTR